MNYSYSMSRVNHDGDLIWVAKSNELKNCYGVGDTQTEALEELETNEAAWIEIAHANNYTIPEVIIEPYQSFSGKLTVRLSPREHQAAADQASKQGVSLNQYISDAIVSYTSKRAVVSSLDEYFIRIESLLASVGQIDFYQHVRREKFMSTSLQNYSASSGQYIVKPAGGKNVN